ncbi:IS3 family transposase [Aquella oligotrophica]|uniref:IS3 family transposase n=2 Tax=Aquella oligotrophica TaxID=2067065 RepID=A0A2I7N784_9NEIS|nr:IS3 family transposase [Aquella oligotrophica]AUR51778.1 IS3 family transposase [Aquella oligotrophica]AUR52309.1 IS3 family transposase [Aquella oligotrophica]AUR52475.1 IS3 family transposase [Aquella oligotrophica]AUR52531.1 IS3 family transposase [Aquella oligotrophica]
MVMDSIKAIYIKSKGRYGYRRIRDTLTSKQGMVISYKKVLRLMRKLGLKSRIRKKRNFFGNENLLAANILNRKFQSNLPNRKLVTDITYLKVRGVNYYLSVIYDLFNNEVKSYELSKYNDNPLVIETIKRAFPSMSNDQLILHSDQGSQYTSIAYTSLLKSLGITKSMSRRGNCLDNACIESFFGHLKSESIYLEQISTYEELKLLIDEYIYFYNNDRIQRKLRKMAPIEYRNHFESTRGFL